MRRGNAVLYGPIKFDRDDPTKLNGSYEYHRMQHIVHRAYKTDMAERVLSDTPRDWIHVARIRRVQVPADLAEGSQRQ